MLSENDLHVGRHVWVVDTSLVDPDVFEAVVFRIEDDIAVFPLEQTLESEPWVLFKESEVTVFASEAEANAERNRRVREYAQKLLASIGEGE